MFLGGPQPKTLPGEMRFIWEHHAQLRAEGRNVCACSSLTVGALFSAALQCLWIGLLGSTLAAH